MVQYLRFFIGPAAERPGSDAGKAGNGEWILNTTNKTESKSNAERTITLSDLWRVFLSALPLMVIAAILIVGVGYSYRKLTYRPQYTSKGSFIVLRDRTQTREMTSSQEASYALGMIPSCYEIMTSDTVFDLTAEKLDGKYSARKIKSAVSVSTAEKSLIVTVRATSTDKDVAKVILETFMQTAKERVDQLTSVTDVNSENGTYEIARYCDMPRDAVVSSSFGTMRILLAGVLGAIVVYAVYLILDIFDDRIRTGEDITDVAGLTLLGIVPDAYSSERKYAYKYGKKYAKHYGRYSAIAAQKKGD